MAAKDDLGLLGERLAEEHLTEDGYRILDRRWRCAHGELDLVALDGDTVVFVEVKTRSGLGYGHPFEAITRAKLVRLRRLALAWTAAHPPTAPARSARRMRIDAIAVVGPDSGAAEIEHLVGVG